MKRITTLIAAGLLLLLAACAAPGGGETAVSPTGPSVQVFYNAS